jgi:hypothetical protein
MSTPTAFQGQVERLGDRLVVRLPGEASDVLPSRGQVAADARVNGHPWTTVVEPDGRRGHWLAVDPPLQQALGLQGGETVDVELTPTKAWPEPQLPDDLDAALADAPDLEEHWAGLTTMARWEWVRWVGATKSPQTRQKRVGVSIDKLRKGSRRPCCFDLSSCTDPELARSGRLVEPDSA